MKKVFVEKHDGGFVIECQTESRGNYDKYIRTTIKGALSVVERYLDPPALKSKTVIVMCPDCGKDRPIEEWTIVPFRTMAESRFKVTISTDSIYLVCPDCGWDGTKMKLEEK